MAYLQISTEIFTDHVLARLGEETENLLDVIGGELSWLIQHNIGIQGPPRSTPDEFPRMDTRELHNEVTWWIDGESVFVTSLAPHTPFVENIRPFLVRTLEEEFGTLQRVSGSMKEEVPSGRNTFSYGCLPKARNRWYRLD